MTLFGRNATIHFPHREKEMNFVTKLYNSRQHKLNRIKLNFNSITVESDKRFLNICQNKYRKCGKFNFELNFGASHRWRKIGYGDYRWIGWNPKSFGKPNHAIGWWNHQQKCKWNGSLSTEKLPQLQRIFVYV